MPWTGINVGETCTGSAHDQLVNGVGEKSTDLVASILKSYDNGVTDEFIKPIVAVDERDEAMRVR